KKHTSRSPPRQVTDPRHLSSPILHHQYLIRRFAPCITRIVVAPFPQTSVSIKSLAAHATSIHPPPQSIYNRKHSQITRKGEERSFSGGGDVWKRQGREGARQGRSQAAPEGAARQHPGHHQAGDPASGAQGRREAHLRADLRGDPRRAQDLPRERHPRRRHLHRARPPQDRHRDGRRLRAQAPGTHPLRLRRLGRAI
ncbi:hypothetical protein BRADI_4g37338v3, partial [Brachypodium distachyon]